MLANENGKLIKKAVSIIRPIKVNGRLFGDVGSVLVSEKGNFYSGVSIDTGSGTGFCAEHGAIAVECTLVFGQ